MSELKPCDCGEFPTLCSISRRYHCSNCGRWARVNFGTDEDALKDWNRFCAYQEPDTITRADIPESLIAEIKAEALEKLHGKYGHKTLDGVVIYGEAVLYEAAKLREQKDETV